MAGIGFKLQKIMAEEMYLSKFQGFFYALIISIPIFIFSGRISEIGKWLPYSLIPGAFIFVLLMLGGIIVMIRKK